MLPRPSRVVLRRCACLPSPANAPTGGRLNGLLLLRLLTHPEETHPNRKRGMLSTRQILLSLPCLLLGASMYLRSAVRLRGRGSVLSAPATNAVDSPPASRLLTTLPRVSRTTTSPGQVILEYLLLLLPGGASVTFLVVTQEG